MPDATKEALLAWSGQLCRDAEADVAASRGEPAEQALHGCQELAAGFAALQSERLDDVHEQRFSSTPWPLFREMASAVLERAPQDKGV